MGFGLVRYSARASITLDQLAEQGSGLNQREGAGEENRDRDKRSRWMSVDRKGGRQRKEEWTILEKRERRRGGCGNCRI